jgi:fructose-specific phosphotransferase system IIC component
MIAQLAIGFVSGLLVGVAVFSHAFSRAMVIGLIAGAIVGAIMVDGVEGYVKWATYLPAEMTRLSAFWIGLIAGIFSGGVIWSERRFL